jgi:hypothetical protein
MAAGMLPSAYALGDGGEFRAPMAIAVIGGLIVSTILSLVFVPSFFTVMDDLSRLVSWIGTFLLKPNASDEDDAETEGAPRVPPKVDASAPGALEHDQELKARSARGRIAAE